MTRRWYLGGPTFYLYLVSVLASSCIAFEEV